MATECCFLADGKGVYADKRMGESRAKLSRCDGGVFAVVNSKAKASRGCQALVRMAVVHRRMEGYKGLL